MRVPRGNQTRARSRAVRDVMPLGLSSTRSPSYSEGFMTDAAPFARAWRASITGAWLSNQRESDESSEVYPTESPADVHPSGVRHLQPEGRARAGSRSARSPATNPGRQGGFLADRGTRSRGRIGS